jgi:hypothetical protein
MTAHTTRFQRLSPQRSIPAVDVWAHEEAPVPVVLLFAQSLVVTSQDFYEEVLSHVVLVL